MFSYFINNNTLTFDGMLREVLIVTPLLAVVVECIYQDLCDKPLNSKQGLCIHISHSLSAVSASKRI